MVIACIHNSSRVPHNPYLLDTGGGGAAAAGGGGGGGAAAGAAAAAASPPPPAKMMQGTPNHDIMDMIDNDHSIFTITSYNLTLK